jgi:hypothetical protein
MVLRMQREVDLCFAGPPRRFHPGISERKTWILKQDLDTEGCDGDRAVRNFEVADEAGKAMAHSAIARPSTLRPSRRDPGKREAARHQLERRAMSAMTHGSR